MMDTETTRKEGILNEYFTKRLDEKRVLVTTRHGKWVVLGNEEYSLVAERSYSGKDELCGKLEGAGIILTEKSARDIIKCYSEKYSFLFENKMLYVISFTNKCGLSCAYCYAEGGQKKDMDEKTIKDTSDFILRMPHKRIGLEFQGGDSLMHFEAIRIFLDDIEQKIKGTGKVISTKSIVTNMFLMNEDIADYLIRHDIGIAASLDGPKELHDIHRKAGTKGTYDNTARWLRHFRKRGRIVRLIPTITSQSIKFGAKSIIDEYISHGTDEIYFRPMHMLGRGKTNNALAVSAEDFFEFWKGGIEYLVALWQKGKRMREVNAMALLENMLTPRTSYMCMRRPCGAGISTLAILPGGEVCACDIGKTIPGNTLGNVNDMEYPDLVMRTLENYCITPEFVPLCDTCAFAAYCPTCLCRVQEHFGRGVPMTPRNFECKATRMMLEYLFKMFMAEEYRKVFEQWISN